MYVVCRLIYKNCFLQSITVIFGGKTLTGLPIQFNFSAFVYRNQPRFLNILHIYLQMPLPMTLGHSPLL